MSLPKRFFGAPTPDDPASTAQVELPRLPVPPLDQTMAGYLATLQPLLTTSQLEYTRGLVQAFSGPGGVGHKIQEQLYQRQQALDNWAYEWWLHDMYYDIPLCLPVNVSPGMVFPPRVFRSNADIARYAARLVTLAAHHKDKLDRQALLVERAISREKGQPLCMAQYYRLFSSYREPGLQRDSLSSIHPTTEHIIVACSNQLYALYLKREGSEDRLSEDQLASQISHILGTSASSRAPPVGVLTSQRRDHWAESRDLLKKDERNRQNLETIENCMLVICLDQKPLPTKFNRKPGPRGAEGHRGEGRDETNMAHQMLHGGGSAFNSANRWFDKTIQLVICPDGVNGLCYEHSPSEGIAVIQLMEEFLENCRDLEPSTSSVPPSSSSLQPLQWNLSPVLEKHIRDASQSIDNLVEDLDFYVYRYNGYGKDFIKSCNVSPDVYIQLALQLAYYKLYGRLTATYESASTRRFLLGRVDCIRSATSAALQWVAAMNQSEDTSATSDPLLPNKRVTFSIYTDAEKLKLFDEAVKSQTDIMVSNILGQGIDIHLLGLREQAKEMGLALELFTDDAYKIANHFALSTSQVATQSDSFMGYGPVVPDGYGASYNPKPSQILFCLSAFHSSEITKASRFAHSLEDSLNAMQLLLLQRQK